MKCNLCNSENHRQLIDFGPQPIVHHYLDDPSKDEFRHSFLFHFCDSCGHLFLNEPIEPELLYENYITLSDWKFQPHILRLIELMRNHTSVEEESRILEVGSNDGRFLDVLRSKGFRSLVGIEPAKDAQDAALAKGIITIPGYFDQTVAEQYVCDFGRCDLLLARQVLEHIGDLKTFGSAIEMVLSPGGYVIIEVPDFSCNLRNLDYSLWEEHVNYFTLQTLEYYLSSIGIRTIHSETILFSGKTLIVIGKLVGVEATGRFPLPDILHAQVEHYRDQWPVFSASFNAMLQRHKEDGGKCAVYGAGCRLGSLVNFTGAGTWIECVVDDQKEKQNLYMPGSKLPILSAEHLEGNAIDLCLLAVNTESEQGVINKHLNFVNRGGMFYSVLPPSDRLPPFWKKMISGS